MRLQRVRLQNFRQHVDNTIEFRPGLTGIIGPNGAGKSTILEAIAWAVYGANAARGRNDSIRFSRAAPRAKVTVEVTFDLGGHEYRVVRTLNGAEVYLDNGLNPVAQGIGTATAYLQNKLGMNLEEFSNTYFTGQKELQFLANMGAADRGRFLAQVLGYERLRRAQELAKDRTKTLRAEIAGLSAGLPDPNVLKAEREQAEQRVKEAKKNVARILKTLEKLEADVTAVAPAFKSAQHSKERAQKLNVEIESTVREILSGQREVERAAAALAQVEAAEKSLAALKPQLDELSAVRADAEKQEELSRAHARRGVLQQNEARLLAEIKELVEALARLSQAPGLLTKAQEELLELKKALPETSQKRDSLLSDYQKDVQDNRTELRVIEGQRQEIQAQIQALQAAGEVGKCPICTKALGNEYGTVLEHLQMELEDRNNIAKWRVSRDKQLAKRPDALVEAEHALDQLQRLFEKKTEREAKCQKGVEELWRTTEQQQNKEKQLAELRHDISQVAQGYNTEEHMRLRTRLAELQQFVKQAGVYEHEIAQRAERTKDLHTAKAREAVLVETQQKMRAELTALGFDEKAYEKLKTQYEKLMVEAQAAKVMGAQTQQVMVGAENELLTARRAEAAYAEKREKLAGLESDLRYHTEMDGAVARLRSELNARVRPELSELASAFLTDITDGRYNALEIDESYNVLVLEDGEEKPVISGGEEDVANLVLRIAISQMIADRAGQQLSTLFLDEVFASLDIERRDNVIQLLQKLHDRFEQVILITHVETVREGLDHVIRLNYDPRTGASVMTAEAPHTLSLFSEV